LIDNYIVYYLVIFMCFVFAGRDFAEGCSAFQRKELEKNRYYFGSRPTYIVCISNFIKLYAWNLICLTGRYKLGEKGLRFMGFNILVPSTSLVFLLYFSHTHRDILSTFNLPKLIMQYFVMWPVLIAEFVCSWVFQG